MSLLCIDFNFVVYIAKFGVTASYDTVVFVVVAVC